MQSRPTIPPTQKEVAELYSKLESADANVLRRLAEYSHWCSTRKKKKKSILKPGERRNVATKVFSRLLSPLVSMYASSFSTNDCRTFLSSALRVLQELVPSESRRFKAKAFDGTRFTQEMDLKAELHHGRLLGERFIANAKLTAADSNVQAEIRAFMEMLMDPFASSSFDGLSASQALYVDCLYPAINEHDLGSVWDETISNDQMLNDLLMPLLRFEGAVLAGLTEESVLVARCEHCRTFFATAIRPRRTHNTCSGGCTQGLERTVRKENPEEWNSKKREYRAHHFRKLLK